MPIIGSRSQYYNKLQYNTDSTSHLRRISSRVRVIQGLRLESSRVASHQNMTRAATQVESRVHSSALNMDQPADIVSFSVYKSSN